MSSNFRIRQTALAIILVAAVIGAFLLAMHLPATGAVASTEESCVPSEAWTETIEHPAVMGEEEVFSYWQRYSWVGGPHGPDTAPAFPGPDWQPNVQGDPHGVGVEGAYYRSNGNSGKGDWFYLEAVTEIVPIVIEEAWTEYIEHPAVICEEPTEEPTPTDDPTMTPTDEPTTGVETPAETLTLTPEEVDEIDKEDPIVQIETTNEPTKTVKRYTHASGRTTMTVIKYDGDITEEGL
jgi:hypothetical protein